MKNNSNKPCWFAHSLLFLQKLAESVQFRQQMMIRAEIGIQSCSFYTGKDFVNQHGFVVLTRNHANSPVEWQSFCQMA